MRLTIMANIIAGACPVNIINSLNCAITAKYILRFDYPSQSFAMSSETTDSLPIAKFGELGGDHSFNRRLLLLTVCVKVNRKFMIRGFNKVCV